MDMFQGQGIGTWLLSNAEVMALDRGLEWATIAAAKENTGARRLYERLGYKIYGENNGSWSYVDHRGITREVNEACWLLEKKLELR
jgi:ribosomal protein S18 acetylase RimI-like enzyme